MGKNKGDNKKNTKREKNIFVTSFLKIIENPTFIRRWKNKIQEETGKMTSLINTGEHLKEKP